MGLRFRKSLRLARGLRLNVSKSGLSLTAGARGASIGVGGRGTYLNTGIPGTGIYARERIGGSTSRKRSASSTGSSGRGAAGHVEVTVSVDDDGVVGFMNADGMPLDENAIKAAKSQQGDVIRALIQAKCDEINANVEDLGRIHLDTPPPTERPRFEASAFDVSSPSRPKMAEVGFLGKLFRGVRTKIEERNAEALKQYAEERQAWDHDKADFEREQARRKILIDKVLSGAQTAMEIYLEQRLEEIAWPQETDVSFEIDRGGPRRIDLDVDLPEIEDMPRKLASVPLRGYRLSVKEMSATQVQKLYMNHVHGVAFRLIGEAFAALPTIEEVVLSGYSQRPDKATGRIGDEYLYSVRVLRPNWGEIDFENLEALDVVEALARFELRREMTKTGIFKAIEPISSMPVDG